MEKLKQKKREIQILTDKLYPPTQDVNNTQGKVSLSSSTNESERQDKVTSVLWCEFHIYHIQVKTYLILQLTDLV